MARCETHTGELFGNIEKEISLLLQVFKCVFGAASTAK
jgi:hypothetical protein